MFNLKVAKEDEAVEAEEECCTVWLYIRVGIVGCVEKRALACRVLVHDALCSAEETDVHVVFVIVMLEDCPDEKRNSLVLVHVGPQAYSCTIQLLDVFAL